MSNNVFVRLTAIFVIASTSFISTDASAKEVSAADYSVTPRQLISLARQGRFKAQGIPSHSNFRSAVRTKRITATELIESAIADNRLPRSVRDNQQYIDTLTSHLKSGGCGS